MGRHERNIRLGSGEHPHRERPPRHAVHELGGDGFAHRSGRLGELADFPLRKVARDDEAHRLDDREARRVAAQSRPHALDRPVVPVRARGGRRGEGAKRGEDREQGGCKASRSDRSHAPGRHSPRRLAPVHRMVGPPGPRLSASPPRAAA